MIKGLEVGLGGCVGEVTQFRVEVLLVGGKEVVVRTGESRTRLLRRDASALLDFGQHGW